MRSELPAGPFAGVILREFIETCGGCPSQWEAVGPDGESVYIRLRNGYFRVDVDGDTKFEAHPDGFDGVMGEDEMLKLTGFTVGSRKQDDE